jgi:hypothetical protein
VLLGSMILMLFAATGRRWTSPLTIAGLCGTGMMVVSSISFTSLNAMVFAFILFFAFTRPVIGRWLPLPAVLAVIVAIVSLMAITLSKEIPTDGSEVALFERSKWQRERIIQDSWTQVPNAGLFGNGRGIDTRGIGIGSVDNAYILFILLNGWLHLTMWIILSLVVGYKGIQLLGKANTPSERIPSPPRWRERLRSFLPCTRSFTASFTRCYFA